MHGAVAWPCLQPGRYFSAIQDTEPAGARRSPHIPQKDVLSKRATEPRRVPLSLSNKVRFTLRFE